MSIWATILVLDDDHTDTCTIWQPTGSDARFQICTPTGSCDCGRPNQPYLYSGSHILPAPDDPRGGSVQLAEVPSHITRDGRDDNPEDTIPWPWLRLSTTALDTILDVSQARQLAGALARWLATQPATDTATSTWTHGRVAALYETWKTAGAPPAGTSLSRWWDQHLQQLGEALFAEPAPHHHLHPAVGAWHAAFDRANTAETRVHELTSRLEHVRATTARMRAITRTWEPAADLVDAALNGTDPLQEPSPSPSPQETPRTADDSARTGARVPLDELSPPLLTALYDERDQLRALVDRGWDQHMSFTLIRPDGTDEQLPCADWCYACRLSRLEADTDDARAELEGARATIDHMAKAMDWICGHDRQGLDHLDEAQYEARAREAAVQQARQWAARARLAEAIAGQFKAVVEAHRAHLELTDPVLLSKLTAALLVSSKG